jgi:hypothetical protein
MIQWCAYNFGKQLTGIEKMRHQAMDAVKVAGRDAKVIGIESGKVIGERNAIYKYLEDFAKECDTLKLESSIKRTVELMIQIGDPSKEFHWTDVESGLKGIQWAVESDLMFRDFAFIPPAKSEFFEKDDLFGESVNKAFPVAKSEIKDAGNCLAADLYSAAIFHLMRVVEFGMREMAFQLKAKTLIKKLKQTNIPIELGTWDELETTLQTKLDELRTKTRSSERQSQIEFQVELLNEFHAIKDLWRNKVMHARATYDEHDARGAFEHVRKFMQKLAQNSVKRAPR